MMKTEVACDPFIIWLAGGGVRGGMTHGQTDEFGYYVQDNKVTMPDLPSQFHNRLNIAVRLFSIQGR